MLLVQNSNECCNTETAAAPEADPEGKVPFQRSAPISASLRLMAAPGPYCVEIR